MTEVTLPRLWQFLDAHCDDDTTYAQYVEEFAELPGHLYHRGLRTKSQPLTEALFIALRDAKRDGALVEILVDQGFSETHPGGDTVIGIVEDTIEAKNNGMSIATWYGPRTECLIAAYDEDTIKVIE